MFGKCKVAVRTDNSPRIGFECRKLLDEDSPLTITMYGIPNCDTIKKARVWLEGRKVGYAFHDYRAQGLDAKRLDGWVDKVGWEILLNKASTTFRALADDEKKDLTPKKAKALMLQHPTMIKRPVLDLGERLLVGFKPDVYAQELSGR
jgi:Spx/MgsR family transcriptional regulator